MPRLASEPYHLVYDKVNSVDWLAQMTQANGSGTKQYTLPSIGYQSFNMYEIKSDVDKIDSVTFTFRVPNQIGFSILQLFHQLHYKYYLWKFQL